MARPKPVYRYAARVSALGDGDTFHVTAILLPWPEVTATLKLRLDGMNAREEDEAGGPEAAAALAALIPVGTAVTVTLLRQDQYGRSVAKVVRDSDGVDVSARMIADGFAAPWNGSGPKPVAPWPRPQDVAA